MSFGGGITLKFFKKFSLVTEQQLPHFLFLPAFDSYHQAFSFYDFDFSRYISVSAIMQHLPFCDWRTSLSIMPSRCMHVIVYGGIYFFSWLNNIPYVYIFFYPFIFCCTFRIFLYLDYCEWCCSEHKNANIFCRFWFYCIWIHTQK